MIIFRQFSIRTCVVDIHQSTHNAFLWRGSEGCSLIVLKYLICFTAFCMNLSNKNCVEELYVYLITGFRIKLLFNTWIESKRFPQPNDCQGNGCQGPLYLGLGPSPLLSLHLTFPEFNQVTIHCCVDSESFPLLQSSTLTIQPWHPSFKVAEGK